MELHRLAIIRRAEPQEAIKNGTLTALLAESRDFGESFGPVRPSNLPMQNSKPFSGTLSTGQRYAIFNAAEGPRRNALLIAVTKPGELLPFRKVWKIIEGSPAEIAPVLQRLGETQPKHEWAYPEAVEKDGMLHVVFSQNKRHCWLARIPVKSLAVAETEPCRSTAPPETRLAAYRAELDGFRKEHGGARELPDVRFFLFGMGQRAKFIYREGRLLDARSGKVVREWKLKTDIIVPPDYLVALETTAGARVNIVEDEEAFWIEEGGQRISVEGTRAPVKLPTFAGRRYAQVLRVLHQELLVNITPAEPVPNFFVYSKPWYRDGAMMALAFRETGNLDLVREWILGLREPFDRNNAGVTTKNFNGKKNIVTTQVPARHGRAPEGIGDSQSREHSA